MHVVMAARAVMAAGRAAEAPRRANQSQAEGQATVAAARTKVLPLADPLAQRRSLVLLQSKACRTLRQTRAARTARGPAAAERSRHLTIRTAMATVQERTGPTHLVGPDRVRAETERATKTPTGLGLAVVAEPETAVPRRVPMQVLGIRRAMMALWEHPTGSIPMQHPGPTVLVR